MLTLEECNALMFRSYDRVAHTLSGYDQHTRDLTAMRDLFEQANIDVDFAPAITVTGSKGKGSTSMLTAAILQGMGFRVGLFTSPHMLDERERIRLDGVMIPEMDYARIVSDLAPHITAIDNHLPPGKYLSPTGLFLAVALRYFKDQECNALVLEVGRGGRYDEVKLVRNNISVFTPITGEHLDRMGPTIEDIAWHKTGIIKFKNLVISAPQPPEVAEVIQREAAALDAKLLYAGQEFTWSTRFEEGLQRITVQMPYDQVTFILNTPALYQSLNIALAWGATNMITWDAVEAQRYSQIAIGGARSYRSNLGQINAALRRLRFPGRCDKVSDAPAVWIDGAIHRESATLFRQSIEAQITRPLVLVTALPDDKDARGVLETLAPLADRVLVTRLQAKHLHFSDTALNLAREFNPNSEPAADPNTAFERALQIVGTTGTVWVVGTQSLVREALRFWKQDLTSIFRPEA
jgi:dihydrofolate synthase / folylpolyglutamate synthase